LSADPSSEFLNEIWGSCAMLLRIQDPSVMLRCAVGWVIPDISKEHNDKNSSRTAWSLEMKTLWSFRVLGPTYPATHCHSLEDSYPQEWWLLIWCRVVIVLSMHGPTFNLSYSFECGPCPSSPTQKNNLHSWVTRYEVFTVVTMKSW